MAKQLHLGSRDGVFLELQLDTKRDDEPGLIWGKGRLRINGADVLVGEHDGAVAWTWVDLLEWLAKNWAYLLCEQSFPFHVAATGISTLMRDLEKRWENMAEERVEDEEEEAYRFLDRHDLVSAFKGLYFPAIFVMRQGALVEVSNVENGKTVRLPLEQVVTDLEAIGNKLASLAHGASQGRGQLAAQHWLARGQQLETRALPLLTGLSSEALALMNPKNDSTFWEQNPATPLADSELMAAARMTSGVLLAEEQVQIFDMIRGLDNTSTDELDTLTDALAIDFKEVGKPYDQGYWAATWLRRKLCLKEAEVVQPAVLLRAWGVRIQDFEMPECKLDALACWGPRHGPAILVNKSHESTPAHLHGENTTLAHEICHLLLDRKGALPVAEVLNGNTPERLEKRARAFAAEFLLPRCIAATAVQQASALKDAVVNLSDKYAVSNELVCWQIINSETYTALSDNEQRWLQSLVGRKG